MKIIANDKIKLYQNGFSLIEIMIVIGVLAIVASFAVPSYRQYIIKSQRSEAHRILNQILIQAERYYNENNSRYPTSINEAYGNLPVPNSTFYTYSLSDQCSLTSTSPCAEARAVAVGSQANDLAACQTLRLDTLGRRNPTLPECWNQ